MRTTRKELPIILQEGEGYRIEFKERISDLDRKMAAFANASGGRIFLGVSDAGIIKGISIDNKLRSQVQDIANNCDPAIKIQIQELDNILVINVYEGTDKPYKCGSGFYTRTGPNAQKLNRNQIVEFIKAEGKIRFDELIYKPFSVKDIDKEKVNRFLKIAGISSVLGSNLLYKNLGFGELQDKQFSLITLLFFSLLVIWRIFITVQSLPACFIRGMTKL